MSKKIPDTKTAMRWAFPEDEVKLPWLSLLSDAYAVIDKGISIAESRGKRKQKKRQLSSHDAKPPCPFLIDSIYSVYPVRPIACRQYMVLGRYCSNGEDPYYTRREDVLTPIREFTDQAVHIMMPFCDIMRETDRTNA